jgi:monoamine oxidase
VSLDTARFDTGVVIVGAGVAGLAAAAELRRAKVPHVVLEAGARIGGRAVTEHPPQLGGAPFDPGAAWLHQADRNPLVGLARAAGETLTDNRGEWVRRALVDGRPATEAEFAAYDASWDSFLRRGEAWQGPDVSVSEAAGPLAADPWLATVLAFESTLIAAADPDAFSLRDWRLNQLTGSDLGAPDGLGALLARLLAPPRQTLRLNARVHGIAWDRPGGGVEVASDAGRLTARAVIVTVSTGVLRTGAIRFDPALPDAQRAALDGLPMGLLTKVALRMQGAERFGLAPGVSLHRRLADPSEPAMFWLMWPQGRDHVIGFTGGRPAWDLSRAGVAATEAFARAELDRMLGPGTAAQFGPAVVTRWGDDPAACGAYAYARPGCMEARAAMDAPLAGRLAFAGEAWRSDGLAGTVGGAFLSGREAARRLCGTSA